jgi:hypothetical protein
MLGIATRRLVPHPKGQQSVCHRTRYLRWWGFALAVLLSTGLGICLVHTFSRGGLVAAGAGLAVAAWFAPRPWPKARLAVGISSAAVVLSALFFLNAHNRVKQGLAAEDRSISNRLLIWKAAPQMMHDAPGGWGAGNAVTAYMEWYQPLERTEKYRTLVNSHIRWLVEFSWPQRVGYVFGWVAALEWVRRDLPCDQTHRARLHQRNPTHRGRLRRRLW